MPGPYKDKEEVMAEVIRQVKMLNDRYPELSFVECARLLREEIDHRKATGRL